MTHSTERKQRAQFSSGRKEYCPKCGQPAVRWTIDTHHDERAFPACPEHYEDGPTLPTLYEWTTGELLDVPLDPPPPPVPEGLEDWFDQLMKAKGYT